MQNVSFFQCNHPVFQCILCSSSQAFWSHQWRRFLVVIEATYALHSWLHDCWQIFIHTKLLFEAQTWLFYGARSWLYGGGCRKSSNFSCLIASRVGAGECGHVLFLSKRTPETADFCAYCEELTFPYKHIHCLLTTKQITVCCSTVM